MIQGQPAMPKNKFFLKKERESKVKLTCSSFLVLSNHEEEEEEHKITPKYNIS
jgi:hypothetical protein